MTTNKCLVCGTVFESYRTTARFCSWDCQKEYNREHRKEYEREYYRQNVENTRKKRPKTYAEIKAYNRKHPIREGWRGQQVLGGHSSNFGESVPLACHEMGDD